MPIVSPRPGLSPRAVDAPLAILPPTRLHALTMLSRTDARGRWVVLAGSFMQQALAYTSWYSFSVFLVALVADRGWSRADTALAQSIFIVVSGLASPFSGALLDRYGPRRLLPIGGFLLGPVPIGL